MSEFDNLIKRRAVALKYDSRNNRAPIIVASGMGYLAERITEAAPEAGGAGYEIHFPPLRRECPYTRMIPWQSC